MDARVENPSEQNVPTQKTQPKAEQQAPLERYPYKGAKGLRRKAGWTLPAPDRAEPAAPKREVHANGGEHAPLKESVDKFADARMAKRKQRRGRLRAKLRRSHTNGSLSGRAETFLPV